jgi:DtxR family Mn-dependent transcriptional regulator
LRTQTTGYESIEMYLKTIAELGDDRQPVSIAEIADRLGITTVSTNEMVKRLVTLGYLEHEKYKGVKLTAEGRAIAHNVMRRQRLWECFLVDKLQLSWAGAYELACRLEHATPSVLSEALSAYLDHPTVCPHGNPIPSSEGQITVVDKVSLDGLGRGESARIVSIEPTTTDIYAYLQERQLQPGQVVRVVDIAPLQGPLTLELNGSEVALGRNLARLLFVIPEINEAKDA